MKSGPKSLSIQFCAVSGQILCVSHEFSFHFPWASCSKRPVSNEQSFRLLWASCGVTSGEFALWISGSSDLSVDEEQAAYGVLIMG
jgi:hypothetical protein